MRKGWTKKSYDALYFWIDIKKRESVRKILLGDGLDDIVVRLDAAQNLGDWYKITREAADVVGPDIVETSANEAEAYLLSWPEKGGKEND